MEPWKVRSLYKEKYGIKLSSNHDGRAVLEKKTGKRRIYMQTELDGGKISDMMQVGLTMGVNYLEENLLALGLKWQLVHPEKIIQDDIARGFNIANMRNLGGCRRTHMSKKKDLKEPDMI